MHLLLQLTSKYVLISSASSLVGSLRRYIYIYIYISGSLLLVVSGSLLMRVTMENPVDSWKDAKVGRPICTRSERSF